LAAAAYSLYLSHKMVFHAVQSSSSWWPRSLQASALGVAVLAALAVGALLYWLVERPFVRLRGRLQARADADLAVRPKASTPIAVGQAGRTARGPLAGHRPSGVRSPNHLSLT
jgi:peptidoglycan/LPS O-acetylase OafA/YrhL